MTANEKLALVIRLASMTEDRTDAEQRALVELAWACDVEHNKHTAVAINRRGPGWKPQDLVSLVLYSRVLETGQREIPAPKNWRRRWQTWASESAHA